MPLRFGLEEELFITEPERPNLQSLYYLSKLVWSDPGKYYTHTHCNFTRGEDLHHGLMSGVEISTAAHSDIDSLVDDLAERRRALARASSGLLVPLGHLLDHPEPTNVSGMHIHVSGFADLDRAYANLVYFLPLLVLLSANSPGYGDLYYGPSFRLAKAFAIGPLRTERDYRFQDLIHSKRLDTLEIRALDPVWDLELIRLLLRAVAAIATCERTFPGRREVYNSLRGQIAQKGFIEELQPVYHDLSSLLPIPRDRLLNPPAAKVWEIYRRCGRRGAYAALDQAYRGGPLQPRELTGFRPNYLKMLAGVFGYSLPRLPYNIRKVWLEW